MTRYRCPECGGQVVTVRDGLTTKHEDCLDCSWGRSA